MYYIYEIINSVTKRKYIGMTNNHAKRFKTHMDDLKHGRHSEKLLQKDYVLYGRDSFDYRLLDFAETKKEAHEKEKHYMKLYKTNLEDYGYNCQDTLFNKYQNCKESLNSQNYFYKKFKEMGLPLNAIAQKIGISRASLIRIAIRPKYMKAKVFNNMVNILGFDKYELLQEMGWYEKPKYSEKDLRTFEMYSKLSKENQDLVKKVMVAMLET